MWDWLRSGKSTKAINTERLQNLHKVCNFIFQGYTDHFHNTFDGANTNVLKIATGFYSGLFAYSGWSNLNCLTEEIIKPKRFFHKARIF